jgi:polysaccharide biosynthesis protein PslH
MRSVVVAKYVPWPPNSGDKRRTLGVLRAMRDLGAVTVCAFEGDDEDAAPLRDEGIRVRSVPHRRSLGTLARGMVRGQSITSARFFDPALHDIVREETASDVDLLVINHVQLLAYGQGSNAALTVVDMHNIESSLTCRYAASQRGPKRAILAAETRALLRLERKACEADAVSVVSETDRRRLAEIVRDAGQSPGEVLVVPNAWGEPTPLAGSSKPIVSFVALLSWAPNVDAAVWFAEEVWPHVVAERSDARLVLVGRNPAPAVRALAGPSVEVTGTVAELEPYYAQTSLAVAPLLAGGGSRLKILEALAHARPVVATTIGAEGLEDLIGRGVTVADDPQEMAASILEILSNPELGASMGAAGVEAVRADHSWGAATRPLTDLLSDKLEKA